MREELLLEAQNLRVSFGGQQVVKNISFEIPKDSWVCLVGESGSGKTQTALSLTRLVDGAGVSGSVVWRGDASPRNLLELSGQELTAVRGRHIAYVFQDPHSALDPVMTVGEQMAEAYTAHFRCGPEEAAKASLISLGEVRLDARRVFASYPHELSGGMKQRVAIATALLNGPKLLIADEPTTSLDVTIEKGIIDLMSDLRTEWPMSYLFITHNICLASRVADHIYVMKSGEIIEKMARGLKGFEPKENYTRMLFGAGLENVRPRTEIPV